MSALSRASDTTACLSLLHRLPTSPLPSNLTNTVPLCSFKFHINHRCRHRHSLISPPLLKTPNPFPSMAHSNNPSSDTVDPTCAEIIVVRHGETVWNVDGRLQGHIDVELNEFGREQAAVVADRLSREFKVSAVYSSDLKRAFETAEKIAATCDIAEVIKDPDLRERHLGDLQGLVLQEAAKVSAVAYRAFKSHRTNQDIPGGGESLDKLYDRCTSSLERIAAKHTGERVVVVTHGGVIRELYQRACPNGKSGGRVLNTSINIFHISDGDRWTIKTWGDVSHLNETGYLNSGFGGDKTSG